MENATRQMERLIASWPPPPDSPGLTPGLSGGGGQLAINRSIWRVAFSICGERCGAVAAFCGAFRLRVCK